MDPRTLTEILDTIHQTEPASEHDGHFYSIIFIARYLQRLFSFPTDPATATVEDVAEDEAAQVMADAHELEWAVMRLFMSRADCQLYSLERRDGLKLIGVPCKLFDALLPTLAPSLERFTGKGLAAVHLPARHVYPSARWIAPKRYEKLKAQLKKDREHNLFVLRGPAIAATVLAEIDRGACTSIVFLDIEAFEFDHQRILEVGLMTVQLEGRSVIMPLSRHFLIKENMRLHNGKNVANRKMHYAFGRSEHATMRDVAERVRVALGHPGAILVGHSICSDIEFMRCSGHALPAALISPTRVFDTQAMMAQHQRRPGLRASLEACLKHLGISSVDGELHNAGNDAWYTSLVFFALLGCKIDQQAWRRHALKQTLNAANE